MASVRNLLAASRQLLGGLGHGAASATSAMALAKPSLVPVSRQALLGAFATGGRVSVSLRVNSASAAQPEEAAMETPPDNMMSTEVNGKEIWVPKGSSVMQACDAAGVDIPRFCYHPKLSIAGNCR